MATLLKTIDDVKKYVSVNKNISWESLEPYVKQADRKYIKNLVGDIIYNDYVTTVPTDIIEVKVFELLREASANLAWFIYLPLANVQVSDSGIAVVNSNNSKPAEWWQIRDLRRSLLDAGLQAIDEALKIMEANTNTFITWTATESYTIFNELFVNQTETFHRWFGIANSRQTFLALRHYMLETHHQYFTNVLNAATIATIKTEANTTTKQVLEFLQASQVHYTVAKAVESGAFLLTASGMYKQFDELPGYKTNPLTEVQLSNLKQERIVAAEEYFKKAINLINANPVLFTNYQPKSAGAVVSFKNTKSTFSL
ncbi:DUF6712 family protein [Tenacibaculum soleae]|uniref:DUF6712 family protein n=1 Tax=Tenacibaculum soleae TaxID=447689 RepID=UPI0026E48EF7|nr:DUF6712 family protein [Tenacibaculum soleae]MDO6813826.1 hypothetical protein [Tenacibaculum soleae]